MAFPVVEARATGAAGSSTTAHTITLPAGIVPGEMLLVAFSHDSNDVIWIDSGFSGNNWNILVRAAGAVTGTIVWKIAEGSDALRLITAGGEGSSHVSFRISGARELQGASAIGSTVDSNPPLLDILPDAIDPLWIAVRCGDSTVVATAAPTGFTNLTSRAGIDINGASTSTAEQALAVTSLDPDPFTSAFEDWVTWTVAVYNLPPQMRVEKAVTYAVEQPTTSLRAEKAVVYAVEQVVTDNTGDARQLVSDRRPVYRAGPIPYVEFGAGDFLTLVTTTAGTYTALFYKPDDTFEQQELTLAVGTNAIPAVNFNQLVIIPGVPTAGTIAGLQAGMRARVIPTS